MSQDWVGRKVLVTGGASFIGSHLVDALLERGATLRVADDLSSTTLEYIRPHIESRQVDFRRVNLCEPGAAREALHGIEVLFHLAAHHGGRGYVDAFQGEQALNFCLDGTVFREALRAKVDKVIYASSGCVYPEHIQCDPSEELYLTEDLIGPPYNADGMYGWTKLMGELTLKSFYEEYGLKSASCRFFTVYGPRAKEDHAVMAMIAKAFIGQNPIEIWGTGEQIRNWTFVDDIVAGIILAAERINDSTSVNLGTMERTSVIEAMQMVLEEMGLEAEIVMRPNMPTGPLNRVADNLRAREITGWQPKVPFREGLKRTIDWYKSAKTKESVRKIIEAGGLVHRTVGAEA